MRNYASHATPWNLRKEHIRMLRWTKNKMAGQHKRTDAAIRFGESTKSNNCKAVGIKKLKINKKTAMRNTRNRFSIL